MSDAADLPAQTPLELLVHVQDLDITLSQLEHRRRSLAERAELEAAEGAVARIDGQVSHLVRQRKALTDKQGELDAQVAAITARRKAIEDRMYQSRGTAARDLQAMDEEVRHLTQRRAAIEDEELALMEEQEPLDAELGRLGTERAQLAEVAESLGTALRAAEAVLQAEVSTVEQARGMAAALLPTALGDHYETLRARLGGIGAARLVGNHCEGCHLELPSAEVDRIHHLPAGTVVTCDQCGRILVPAPRSGGA